MPTLSEMAQSRLAKPDQKPAKKGFFWTLVIGAVALCLFVGIASGTSGSGSSARQQKSQETLVAEYETGLADLKAAIASADAGLLKQAAAGLKNPPNEQLGSEFETLSVEAARIVSEQSVSEIIGSDDDLDDKFFRFRHLLSILKQDFLSDSASLAAAEDAVRQLVVGIPASELENNVEGYKLLSEFDPANDQYKEKAEAYKARIKQREEEEKKKAELEKKQRIRRILSNYTSNTDKFSATTFYKHKNSPVYTNSRSTVYLYIGVSGSQAWLRMKTQYESDDWLFVERVEAYADGATFTLTSGQFERDHNSTIWEWQDENPSDLQLLQLERLANAKDATLRFIGHQYRKDKKLGPGDKAALKAVLKDFEELQAALKS